MYKDTYKIIITLFMFPIFTGFTIFNDNSAYVCENKWTRIASGANMYRPDANGTFVDIRNDTLMVRRMNDQWIVEFNKVKYYDSNGFNSNDWERNVSVNLSVVKFGMRSNPNAGHERYITYVYEFNKLTGNFGGKIKDVSLVGGSSKTEIDINGVCKEKKIDDWFSLN